jgi:hypothetical protein
MNTFGFLPLASNVFSIPYKIILILFLFMGLDISQKMKIIPLEEAFHETHPPDCSDSLVSGAGPAAL